MMEGDDETGEDIVFSYPEWQVNTFAVDCSGRRAVLAVQKWLAVVSLENSEKAKESKALRKLGRQNKYEIKAVLWNPHAFQQELLASTSQQKLEVWNLRAERHPLLYSIKAHTRPVSDLSWSFTDSNLLASCAVDSFVHIWDIRETRRPKTSFRAVAGASLVQWNRVNGSILASAHDSDIRIWDMRKPTTASGYITAHMSRIHDLDWSHRKERQLTTCSHDASIKFWDTASPREPTSSIKAGTQPLWRARNYPPGYGVAMALVPAMHGGDSRVFLWGRNNVSAPLHVFTGHDEPVLEVQWRHYKGDYQLVSWAKDRTLRVWAISEQLREELGGELVEQTLVEEASLTVPEISVSGEPELSLEQGSGVEDSVQSRGDSPSPTKSVTSSIQSDQSPQVFQPQVAHTLPQEFRLLNLENIPNLEMERLDASQRSCTVRVEQGEHLVRIGITFPSHYPHGAAPSFIFDKSTTVDILNQQELNRILTDTAISYVRQNRGCLEPCLRKLAKALESFVSRPQPPIKQPPDFDNVIAFGHLDDEHIPFPRTSGARFCANGLLVCFGSPPGLIIPPDVTKTPRSLDKLMAYRSHIRPMAWWGGFLSSSLPRRSSSSNLLQLPKRGSSGSLSQQAAGGREKQGHFSGSKGGKGSVDSQTNPYAGLVTIHNATHMLPIDYTLAKSYSLVGSDIKELCAINATAAAHQGRMDLVQAWSATTLIANEEMPVPPNPDTGIPWSQHPFGRELIHSLFDHFAKLHDVQTLAMLACIFQLHCSQHDKKHPINGSNGSNSTSSHGASGITSHSHTSTSKQTTKRGSGGLQEREREKMGSWQEGEGEFLEGEDAMQEEKTSHQMNCRLLDDLLTRKCDEYRRSYGNILHSWGLLDQRAEVLKFQVVKHNTHMEIGFTSLCRHCGELVRGPSCLKSQCFAFICSVCNLSVRGSSNFCLSCGHGGHARHMLEWFAEYSVCPAGCGCKCLEASGWT